MKRLLSKVTLSLFFASATLLAQDKLPEGHPPVGAGGGADPHAGMNMEAGSGSSMGGGEASGPPSAAALEEAMKKKYESPIGKDGTLDLEQVTFKAPAAWTWEAPTSNMRKAQFKLPAADGDKEDGELVIFHFGPQAGSVDENVKRWYGQFEPEGGKPAEEVAKREKTKAGSIDITLVDLAGKMKTGSMSNHPGASEERPNSRLLAAIAETPSGPWFVKATGPAKTMEKHSKDFRDFVLSVKAK